MVYQNLQQIVQSFWKRQDNCYFLIITAALIYYVIILPLAVCIYLISGDGLQ